MGWQNPVKSSRVKPLALSTCCSLLLFSAFAISMLAIMNMPSKVNYAFAQTVRTTEIKVNFNKVVQVGSTQNIRIFVRDMATGLPVSAADARFTIYFPGGAPIRQFTLLTDRNGFASLSLPIDKNAPLGTYGLDVLVGAQGYLDTSFGTVNWAVMSHVSDGLNLQDFRHASSTINSINHHHHN